MSVQENANNILAIQVELANSKKLSELSQSERRQVIAQVFPNGVALNALDPQVKTGDLVYGEGFTNVNAGNFFFGEALTDGPYAAGTAQEDVDIKVKLG